MYSVVYIKNTNVVKVVYCIAIFAISDEIKNIDSEDMIFININIINILSIFFDTSLIDNSIREKIAINEIDNIIAIGMVTILSRG